MIVLNYSTGKRESSGRLTYGIVNIDDKHAELGWFSVNSNVSLVNVKGEICWAIDDSMLKSAGYVYSNYYGYYLSPSDASIETTMIKGSGDYPYIINKNYGAEKSFNIYKNKQKLISEEKSYQFTDKDIPYSFGLEFETSCGYVPQANCFRDGLIPLRDGSIGGIEYSTVILKGNYGLNLLEQEVKDLYKYTEFDKECALHIHLGGYPINEISIFTLYNVFEQVQDSIAQIIPPHSFNTERYKANGKSYCKRITHFNTFNDMYSYYSCGTPYFGSLCQAHPNDKARERKWNINTRYHNINFINMLFYDSAKTIEFRFLRPTYNFNKITWWIVFLSSILKYAEILSKNFKSISECEAHFANEYKLLRDLARSPISVYNIANSSVNSDAVKTFINDGITKSKVVRSNQLKCGDYCGLRIDIENKIF